MSVGDRILVLNDGWFKGTVIYRDTTAAAGGTTTLSSASSMNQVFTGTSNQTCKLPSSNIYYGMEYFIINDSSGTITVQSSNTNTIDTVAAGAGKLFKSLKDSPTASTHWRVI